MDKFKFFLFILFLGLFLSYNFAQAKIINDVFGEENSCFFGEDFVKFKNILENPQSDYLAQYNLEISLRKKLLNQTLDCLIERAKNLKSAVNAIKINDNLNNKSDFLGVLNILNKKIDDALDYYNFRKNQIAGSSLEGLKYTAKSLIEDRNNNFINLENIAFDFVLWGKNNELFNSAIQRKNEIDKAINLFKPDENEEIKKVIDEINKNFDLAKQNHNEALKAINNFDHEKASNLIKDSLTNLLETYKNFYDLSQKTRLF